MVHSWCMNKLLSSFRETATTFIDAYFVYSNGTALTPVEVEEMLSKRDHYLVLIELGLKNVVSISNFRADVLFSEWGFFSEVLYLL